MTYLLFFLLSEIRESSPINTLYKETNVEMQTYLIKLNHPVLVNNSTSSNTHYDTLYGFVTAIPEKTTERVFLRKAIRDYLCYLGENNVEEKPGIDFTLYLIDSNDVAPFLRDMDNHQITDPALLETLIKHALEQKKIEPTVFLFNRPIWLPNHILWDKADGYSSIYGIVTHVELNEKRRAHLSNYLGYLALCEEYFLSGTTPSGFSTENYHIWYRDDVPYCFIDKELINECCICQRKHNLTGFVAEIPAAGRELNEGVRNEFLIDKGIYERLLAVCGCPNLTDIHHPGD